MKGKHRAILFGIIALHLIFVSFSLTKPFGGDEVIFIQAADAIAKTGKPLFDSDLFRTNYLFLEHPPTYIYLMGLLIKVGGLYPFTIRLISILFNLGVIFLVYSLALFLIGKEHQQWALFAVALYALNPLTIQSSIILDIDGGLLNFFMLLFISFFLKEKSSTHLIPSLFMVFWSKLSGAVIIIGSLIIYSLWTRERKKFNQIIFIIFSSSLLFLISFWIFTQAMDFDFLRPFQHSSIISGFMVLWSKPFISLSRSFWSFKTFFYFTIPFFVITFFTLAYLFMRRKEYLVDKRALFLCITALVTLAFFFIAGTTGWNFPKYYITALPLMALFTSWMLKQIQFTMKRDFTLYSFLSLALLAYFLLFLRDPLIPEISTTVQHAQLFLSLSIISKRFFLYVLFPLGFVVLVSFIIVRKKQFFTHLIFLTFFLYLYLGIIQATALYPTHNLYGTTGLQETLLYLNQKEIPSEQIAAYPHVGYYLGFNRFYDLTLAYNDQKKFQKEILGRKKITHIVMFKKDFDRIGQENLKEFEQEKQFGDYYILHRRL